MATRVRNPEKALVKTAQRFAEAPKEAAEKLQRLSEQEGYLFVMDAVRALECVHFKRPDLLARLSILRMPEWEWRSMGTPGVYCFGIFEDGAFEPHGICNPVKNVKGFLRFTHSVNAGDLVDNILDRYERGHIRNKIYKKGTKYYIVQAGATLDLVLSGCDFGDIQLTRGRGYLNKFQAFTVVNGPYFDIELARKFLQTIN